MAETLEARIAVLEALAAERVVAGRNALALVRSDLERRLSDMNHWRAEEIADKATFLRAETYEKSENLHRAEREALADRVKVLEIRITQVATVGAILLLAVPFVTLIAAHYLLK